MYIIGVPAEHPCRGSIKLIKNAGTTIIPGEGISSTILFETAIKSGEITEIRSVSLPDVTNDLDVKNYSYYMYGRGTNHVMEKDKNGLFCLDQYTPSPGVLNCRYFLAFPSGYNPYSYNGDVCVFNVCVRGSNTDYLDCDYYAFHGVRPVIKIEGAKLKLNGSVWEFVEK